MYGRKTIVHWIMCKQQVTQYCNEVKNKVNYSAAYSKVKDKYWKQFKKFVGNADSSNYDTQVFCRFFQWLKVDKQYSKSTMKIYMSSLSYWWGQENGCNFHQVYPEVKTFIKGLEELSSTQAKACRDSEETLKIL
jgi:hypothetical protein